VEGARAKGWGSCYQTGDQSGWEFATMSKKLALQVSWGFLFFCKGFNKTACTLCKYKLDSCVQVKTKPCVECTIIMLFISWNLSRGSETKTLFTRIQEEKIVENI
jgi:hypothetical protein